MEASFKIVKITNIIALLFLLLGAYGLAITGGLQVMAALGFTFLFPKNKLIYIYFGLVTLFFLLWDQEHFNWTFCIPFFLIFFLTFIIYNQKITL